MVSVIITTYNQLHFLDRALNSVLNQDYPNLQIVVGDDASIDGDVASFLSNYEDRRILFVKQPKNLGRHDHYKTLLHHHAAGEWATILNADDFYTNPSYISDAIKLIQSDSEIVLVYGKTGIFVEDTERIICDSASEYLPDMIEGNQLLLNQLRGHIIPHITSLYHRATALQLNFYAAKILSEDWESLLRIIQGKKVGHISKLSGLYGRHHKNVSKSLDLYVAMANLEYILSPYRLAKNMGQIKTSVLDQWKEDMIYRYVVKIYIKLSLWDQKNVKNFLNRIEAEIPSTHRRLKNDYKIKLFNIIKNNDIFLKIAFKYYLRQEAVIADFLQHRKYAKGTQLP